MVAAWKRADVAHAFAAIHFGHHDIHANQTVALSSLKRISNSLHGFPAVHGDVAVAVPGKEGLLHKTAGRLVPGGDSSVQADGVNGPKLPRWYNRLSQ